MIQALIHSFPEKNVNILNLSLVNWSVKIICHQLHGLRFWPAFQWLHSCALRYNDEMLSISVFSVCSFVLPFFVCRSVTIGASILWWAICPNIWAKCCNSRSRIMVFTHRCHTWWCGVYQYQLVSSAISWLFVVSSP